MDARLERGCEAPLAVAFSGGGDSLALLLAAKAWADGAGRRLMALTVDHRLQPQGAEWARWCQARAARLGVAHQTLVWEGPKPTSGLSAAARRARHALLAQAARRAGARVILMGHTADDILEAVAMRAAGSSVGEPRVWSPSPAWPEGAGVFILRPLLTLRRAQLRAWLGEETWIEDPANIDPRSARARARAALAADAPVPSTAENRGAKLAARARIDASGAIVIARSELSGAEARAFIGAAALSAAGTDRPPRGASLGRLAAAIASPGPFVATLAGARIEAAGAWVTFHAEAGERRRRGAPRPPPPSPGPSLALARLRAACGAIQSEAAIGRVAETRPNP